MQNDNKSAGSFDMGLQQIIALFKGKEDSEAPVKGLLYIVGVFFTPITMFGALMGFKRAYERIHQPKGEMPELTKLKTITWVAMIFGAIAVWVIIAGLIVLIIKAVSLFFDSGIDYMIGFAIMAFNLVISAVIFRFFKRWQNNIGKHLIEAGRFGSARWATKEDLADLERKQGIYIGGGLYGYGKQGHYLTVGGARGGKGVNAICPNLLGLSGYDGSWFIIDVKGELTAVSARYQREKGQDVLILDPWELYTSHGATYNPLDLVSGQNNTDNLIDDISIIAEMIVPKEAQGDQFWNNKARSLIAGLILHLMLSGDKGMRTLATIWQWLRLPEDKLEELFAEMAVSDNAIVQATANEYLSIIHTASKMFLSILAAAQERTDFLKSPALQKSLASSNFDIKNITNGKTTLYVIISPDKLDSHFQWLRLVMTTALRSAVRNRNKKITFLLDEFAALGYIPEIKVALSTYAGYNITMWPIIQDLGQLKTLYGDAWETFISNTAVRQFLSVSDNFSLQYLSSLMGTTTTVSYETDGGKNRANATARSLATPDEIRRGSANNILTLIEQRPVACFPKIPYYEMPTLYDAYDDNPYYAPVEHNFKKHLNGIKY